MDNIVTLCFKNCHRIENLYGRLFCLNLIFDHQMHRKYDTIEIYRLKKINIRLCDDKIRVCVTEMF